VFINICKTFMIDRRPLVQLHDADNFPPVLGDLDAIALLCLAGSLLLPIFPEMTQFEAIPVSILRFLTGKPPTNAPFAPTMNIQTPLTVGC
jgi:hypothetical protein